MVNSWLYFSVVVIFTGNNFCFIPSPIRKHKLRTERTTVDSGYGRGDLSRGDLLSPGDDGKKKERGKSPFR